MMTNATAAPDPIAAATAIVHTAATSGYADIDRVGRDRPSLAPVVALATGILLSLTAMAAMVTSPATIPLWCAAHGGCP